MKKLFMATGLFVAFTSATLFAQTQKFIANIPFDFQLGKKAMPAGKYDLKREGALLTIREADGTHVAVVLTTPASRREAPATPVVQFERYGDSYVMSGLWTADSKEGIAVPQSESKKELARRQAPATTVVALASK